MMDKNEYSSPIATIGVAHYKTDSMDETLYHNCFTGEYFLKGRGKKGTHWDGGSGMQPLTKSFAMAWIREHEHQPGYTQLFDYGEHDDRQKQMISAYLPYYTYKRLQAMARSVGRTNTDILVDLIEKEWHASHPESVYEPLTPNLKK